MLKIIAVTLIFLSISSLGFFYSATLRRHVIMLDSMYRFACDTETKIRYTRTDVFAILRDSVSGGSYPELGFLSDLAKKNEDWSEDSVKSALPQMRHEDAEAVKKFFCGLGQSDCEGQIAHCRLYSEKFLSLKKRAESESENKGRLSRSLSVFAAAGVSILLL